MKKYFLFEKYKHFFSFWCSHLIYLGIYHSETPIFQFRCQFPPIWLNYYKVAFLTSYGLSSEPLLNRFSWDFHDMKVAWWKVRQISCMLPYDCCLSIIFNQLVNAVDVVVRQGCLWSSTTVFESDICLWTIYTIFRSPGKRLLYCYTSQ